MENPCITFISPTIIAGDRSLVNVIAHEIAHSWTGNGVTNRDWRNFWLNEGFTVFLERKIIELNHGEDNRMLAAKVGYENLMTTINALGKEHSFTSLFPDIFNVILISLIIIRLIQMMLLVSSLTKKDF